MAEQFATLAQSTLNGAINSSTTTVVLTSAALFSATGTFRIRIDAELMKVTAVSSNTFTVVRGQEGTLAASHTDLATVSQLVTAASYTQLKTDILALSNMLLPMPADTLITGTTTLTSTAYGLMHNCTGTTSNYAVTLPSAVTAGAGVVIGFKMDAALTKFVTLTSSTGTQLDGATTRVMWANESCILKSDGTQWRKLAGKAVPIICTMRLTADQTGIASTTETVILLDATDTDNTSQVADTTNHRMLVPRTSKYNVMGNIGASNSGANVTRWIASVQRDPNTGSYAIYLQGEGCVVTGGSQQIQAIGWSMPLNANDKLQISLYQNTGVGQSAYGASSGSAAKLFLAETPDW